MLTKLPLTIVETAPCKVNLTLDVYPPRGDGFHVLDSIVATFTPADNLTVKIWQRVGEEPLIWLDCDDTSLPTDERNLAFRAAQAFLARFGEETTSEYAVHLTLAKRLPHQAGLGGGSSDAAAVLRALARVYSVDAGELTRVAAEIGSDVPLFLAGKGLVQRMRGRGEQLSPLPHPMPALHGVIVKPAVGVATGPAYAAMDADPSRVPGGNTARLLALLAGATPPTIEAIGAAMGNDFESIVLTAYPEVQEAHDAVSGVGAIRTLLCGSGAAVFGLAQGPEHAQQMAQALYGRYPFVEVAAMTVAEDVHAQ